MGKQSSNKKYSFTGRRSIIENKSNYLKNNSSSQSLSDGSTTNDMISVLNSDSINSKNRNRPHKSINQMEMSNLNQISVQDMNQMAMPDMNQMAMPGMNQMVIPGMNQMAMPGMNQMAMPGMNQMAMPGMNQMAIPGMNMMGNKSNVNDIDHLMVNTLVPINNQSMNYDSGIEYMNQSQIANNLGSLAKLSNNSIKNNHMGFDFNQHQSNVNLSNLAKLT